MVSANHPSTSVLCHRVRADGSQTTCSALLRHQASKKHSSFSEEVYVGIRAFPAYIRRGPSVKVSSSFLAGPRQLLERLPRSSSIVRAWQRLAGRQLTDIVITGMLKHALLALLSISAFVGLDAFVDAKWVSKAELHAKQAESAARIKANLPRAVSAGPRTGVKNITFSDPRASRRCQIVYC